MSATTVLHRESPATVAPGSATAAAASQLRAAVIGTGKISEEHLRFLAGARGVDLAAVCDLSPALAAYAARRFGAQRHFTDAARMLRDVAPHVVHILTPPHTHVPLVRACLEAGAHVVVEKPVAPTHAQFRELAGLAEQRGLKLIEDQNYRFNRPVLAIERMLRQGQLGEVREVEVRLVLPIRSAGNRYADSNLPHPSHKMPAGVLHEFITHLGYLVTRFMPDVEKISAVWSNHGGGGLFKFDDLDALVVGGNVHARLRFSCHTAPDCFSLIVRGARGWVETDLFHPYLRVVVPRSGGQQLAPLVNHWVNGLALTRAAWSGLWNKVLQRTPLEGLNTFLRLTYEALRSGAEPPVTFDDMDRTARLVDALLDESNRV